MLFTVSCLAAEPLKVDFNDRSLDSWYRVSGDWKVENGQLAQKSANWGRYILFSRIRLEEGTLRAKMRVDKAVFPSGGSFGFLLRYPGEKESTVLRIGAYGIAGLMQPVKNASMGRIAPEAGRIYDIQADVAGDTVTLTIDGKIMASAKMTAHRAPGTIGFYTECAATFADLEITGNWNMGKDPILQETGVPQLQMDFAEWAPTRLDPTMFSSVNGAVYAYYRNVGRGSAMIDSVAFMGKKIDPKNPPDWVSYVRQQPARLAPGEVGQLEIRLSGMPKNIDLNILEKFTDSAMAPVVIAPRRGEPIQLEVEMVDRSPVQINFLGFGRDLKTVYAYVQNNAGLLNPQAKPAVIERVEVNGIDVTNSSRIGSKSVLSIIVPIEITLSKPLAKASATQVVITTAGGRRTGHVLRAFPSKFNILVYMDGNLARKDYLEDIYYHCATAVNRFGDRKKFDELGFDIIALASSNFLAKSIEFRGSPIEGLWIDEVDKTKETTAAGLLRSLEDAQNYLDAQGFIVPLIDFNVVDPRGAAATGFLMIPDVVMHSYGWYMCPSTAKKGFGRVYDLARREFRMARRPFWPYFRDSEIAVPRDPKKKVILARHPEFQRCLTPKEQRWMTYGNIIQGAKSTAHWAYRSTPMPKFYFMCTTPVMRMGLGAVAGDKIGPYIIPDEVVKMLKDVWVEHGRINAELQVIGPLVAVSDVSTLAKVTRVTPAKDRFGDPAAEAAALVSGLDALVVVVLNHSIVPGTSPGKSGPVSNPMPPKYDPVDVTVEVSVPEWLNPQYVFSVDYQTIDDVLPQRDGKQLRFTLPKLEVSKIYVITSSKKVKEDCLARHAEMKKRLEKSITLVPIPDEAWEDKNSK
jgi:hypothetical protein